MKLTSSVFAEGQTVPKKYTGDGDDVSPPLKWTSPPDGTKALALICEDPDAPRGVWTHWILFNLPPESHELSESVKLPDGTVQGTNDFGKIGYGGPAPPPGKPHRYFFKLYALDKQLNLAPGVHRKQVVAAMEEHTLDECQLMGTYGR